MNPKVSATITGVAHGAAALGGVAALGIGIWKNDQQLQLLGGGLLGWASTSSAFLHGIALKAPQAANELAALKPFADALMAVIAPKDKDIVDKVMDVAASATEDVAAAQSSKQIASAVAAEVEAKVDK